MYDALKKLVTPRPLRTMNDIFDKFLLESLPALAVRTQRDYRKYIERLRPAIPSFVLPALEETRQVPP